MRNLSTIPADQLPALRKLLEQDLKSRGVVSSGSDTANLIRVTLSENARERLWVAEIVEGNQTLVVMIHVDAAPVHAAAANTGMMLRKQRIWSMDESLSSTAVPLTDEILAATETSAGLIILRQDEIVVFSMSAAGWREQQRVDIPHRTSSARDPRGMLLRSPDGSGFTAFTGDIQCSGAYSQPADNSGSLGTWTIHCRASDDPWPLVPADPSGNSMKAFYNAARNYFTGVVVPGLGIDLPAFYSVALLPRSSGSFALLLNSLDGKTQIAENNKIKPVSGTRDWGSDFAALHSACGIGAQIIASSSGEAITDSLRAYELPGQEAIPVSAPLAMDGTVTSLATAADGKSLLAIVRQSTGNYEVDRVTALCN
jgi:hypothetical protein